MAIQWSEWTKPIGDKSIKQWSNNGQNGQIMVKMGEAGGWWLRALALRGTAGRVSGPSANKNIQILVKYWSNNGQLMVN